MRHQRPERGEVEVHPVAGGKSREVCRVRRTVRRDQPGKFTEVLGELRGRDYLQEAVCLARCSVTQGHSVFCTIG